MRFGGKAFIYIFAYKFPKSAAGTTGLRAAPMAEKKLCDLSLAPLDK
jgi:hypothetical protein